MVSQGQIRYNTVDITEKLRKRGLTVPDIDLPSGKLILLYMLHQVSSVPSGELMDWAIESLYLDYFSFMQAKEELKRDRFIIEASRKGETRVDAAGRPLELCDITPEGEIVLQQLLPTLPAHIRAYLTKAAPRWRQETHEEASCFAGYMPDANGAFQVHLTLSDGARTTANLTLFAPDEESAQKMCRRWKESTADIYMTILQSLQA